MDALDALVNRIDAALAGWTIGIKPDGDDNKGRVYFKKDKIMQYTIPEANTFENDEMEPFVNAIIKK